MTKIKVKKALGGIEEYNLISAFKIENNIYTIFDGEKLGSMGLPIIYVSKIINNKLEKISDANEWQSAKNYLKGIINGTNFEYIKVDNEIDGDEAFFTPLTLPSGASLELIKSHYVVTESSSDASTASEIPPTTTSNEVVPQTNLEANTPEIPTILETPTESSITEQSNITTPEVPSEIPSIPEIPEINSGIPTEVTPVEPLPIYDTPNPVPLTNEVPSTYPVSTVMPDNNVPSNIVETSIPAPVTPPPIISNIPEAPVVTSIEQINPMNYNANVITPVPPVEPLNLNQTVMPVTQVENQVPVTNNFTEMPATPMTVNQTITEPIVNQAPVIPPVETQAVVQTGFDADREMFLKACENMFDALISKYQKKLADLDARELLLQQKEAEIDQKMQNANEHLRNAEAREQVANIAHDNAQKVMNLNSFMPTNNIETPPTGVI